MKPRPLFSEKALARMREAAAVHWQLRDFDRFVEAMNRVAVMDPGNAALQVEIGSAHGMRYDYAAAERCFGRAIAISPKKIETLATIALQCRNFNRYDWAERYFALAVDEPGATADMFAKLAEMSERLRRPDQARDMVDRALRMDPAGPLALLVKARLFRSSGDLEAAERTVRAFLNRTDAQSWSTRIRGWYELCAILDKAGRYDQAMAACLQAKALIRPQATAAYADQKGVQARLKEAADAVTAGDLRRWHDEDSARLSSPKKFAVLCGHPRSGTTLLEQLLDSHPAIVSAEETPVFFNNFLHIRRSLPGRSSIQSVMQGMTPSLLRQTRDRYFRDMQSFIGEPVGDRALVDKNPSLLGLALALVRVVPETRFIVAVRDPRDVCLSCFMQPLPLNGVSSFYLTLEDTATEYASLMGFWQQIAPRLANAHIQVRYEDVVADTKGTLKVVLDFLGLEWDDRLSQFDRYAREKLVRSPTYADVARPISTSAVGRWRNYRKFIEPSQSRLLPFLASLGYEL